MESQEATGTCPPPRRRDFHLPRFYTLVEGSDPRTFTAADSARSVPSTGRTHGGNLRPPDRVQDFQAFPERGGQTRSQLTMLASDSGTDASSQHPQRHRLWSPSPPARLCRSFLNLQKGRLRQRVKDAVVTRTWQGLDAGAGSRAAQAGLPTAALARLQVEEQWEMGSPRYRRSLPG